MGCGLCRENMSFVCNCFLNRGKNAACCACYVIHAKQMRNVNVITNIAEGDEGRGRKITKYTRHETNERCPGLNLIENKKYLSPRFVLLKKLMKWLMALFNGLMNFITNHKLF